MLLLNSCLSKLHVSFFILDALANIGLKSELALEAFRLAEQYYLKIFTQKMNMNLWSLDEMGLIIASPRSMILEVATKLVAVDSELFADTIVRWKCLNTEFSAFLMRTGLGSVHRKTYRKVFQSHNPIDSPIVLQAASEHKQEENALVQQHGPAILNMLFKQSYHLIQNVLEKDEIVLDYSYLGSIYNDEGTTSELYCGIIAIKPEGRPIIEIFEYNKVGHLSKQWHHFLTTTADSLEISAEARKLSGQLCNVLFPNKVREIIESDKVKRMFLCPDLQISHLPLDLLTFPDGQMLTEKCDVVLLSSSREIIRYDFFAQIDRLSQLNVKQESTDVSVDSKDSDVNQDIAFQKSDTATCDLECRGTQVPPTDIHSNTEMSENVPQAHCSRDEIDHSVSMTKKDKHCTIIANPKFDLEMEQTEKGGDLVDTVKDLLSALFQVPKTKGLAEPLPGTEEEAKSIKNLLTTNNLLSLSIEVLMGSSATIRAVLDVNSPFILHFATHGFAARGDDSYQEPFGGNFWHGTSSGLLLAGANTYASGKYNQMLTDASTGQLSSLAVCGMNLKNTRLVYLSACSSSVGRTITGESTFSLCQAFRAAGAYSVIATRWPVEDSASKVFSTHFYSALCSRRDIHPSEALASAKQKMRLDSHFNWCHWAAYVCVGYDLPLFPTVTD